MFKILFGGNAASTKIVIWLLIIGFFVGGFSYPFLFLLMLIFVIAGPVVAIPALIAINGKHVSVQRSKEEIIKIIYDVFSQKKFQNNYSKCDGMGELNFVLENTKQNANPTISVDFTTSENGLVVSVWMSEYATGGFNGGKGTPFYVWGGIRILSKINQVANAIR